MYEDGGPQASGHVDRSWGRCHAQRPAERSEATVAHVYRRQQNWHYGLSHVMPRGRGVMWSCR